MEKCIKCGSIRLVKFGFTNRKDGKNSQKYKCKECDTSMSEECRIRRLSGAELIIDEIYKYIGNKSSRYYIWTALLIHNDKKYPVFHISKNKGTDSLDEFVRQVPNPDYKQCYGKRNIAKKGIKTNLIESFNSQLRHYCSNLIRKGKSYSKSLASPPTNIHIIFTHKFIPNLI